jgi:hypothetical protein
MSPRRAVHGRRSSLGGRPVECSILVDLVVVHSRLLVHEESSPKSWYPARITPAPANAALADPGSQRVSIAIGAPEPSTLFGTPGPTWMVPVPKQNGSFRGTVRRSAF